MGDDGMGVEKMGDSYMESEERTERFGVNRGFPCKAWSRAGVVLEAMCNLREWGTVR